ncbi:hypothetical protein, partial [Klebsiella pneumoniae]
MPRSTWFKALLLFVALWAPLSQAETGWQPIQETIRKSDKDNRQYQAIRLDNGMVVLLVSDPQAVKSLSALVVPCLLYTSPSPRDLDISRMTSSA